LEPDLYSNGFNFSSDASCNLTAPSDTQNGGNPNLGPLVKNGGPTMTRLPFWYSRLVDAIPLPSRGEPRHQRGIARPRLIQCDIGAVELETHPRNERTRSTALTTRFSRTPAP